MSLNYTTYTQQLAGLLNYTSTESFFQTFINGAIDYSEQRIYREADFLCEIVVDATTQASSGNRNFTLPTTVGTFITVDTMNVITPAGTGSSAGTRVQLQPASRAYLDAIYPTQLSSQCGTPQYFAPVTNTSYTFGPAPDGAYFVEVVGVQRPTALSTSNSSTFLTQYCPDLFMAASMVYGSGYQRDFSAQGDNPQMGQSWENQYQTLMKSVMTEEFRRKIESQGWTAKQPNPVATPPRV